MKKLLILLLFVHSICLYAQERIFFTKSDTLRFSYGPYETHTHTPLPMKVVLDEYSKYGKFELNFAYENMYDGIPQKCIFYSEYDSIIVHYDDSPYKFTIVTPTDTIPAHIAYIVERDFGEELQEYLSLLRMHSEYDCSLPDSLPNFSYQHRSDKNLVELREKYNLDKIAGSVDEISQIINLMKWVHETIEHDGSSENPESQNSLNIIKVCQDSSRGANCRMMATVLNEVYLSMGFSSRFITCMPKGEEFDDCHVTNLVYSKSLDKWIFMDSSFEAYFKNKKGMLLNHSEIRNALINGDSLLVNDSINHNGEPYGGGKIGYLAYIAKNLFRFSCPRNSVFGYESSNRDISYVYLDPISYNPKNLRKVPIRKSGYKTHHYYTKNDKYFWKKPEN